MVKTGTDIVKTTPAGEYLTSALNDFDPEQYDSLAAISDGANKLLMLVGINKYIHAFNWTLEVKSIQLPDYLFCHVFRYSLQSLRQVLLESMKYLLK